MIHFQKTNYNRKLSHVSIFETNHRLLLLLLFIIITNFINLLLLLIIIININ